MLIGKIIRMPVYMCAFRHFVDAVRTPPERDFPKRYQVFHRKEIFQRALGPVFLVNLSGLESFDQFFRL